MVRSPGVNDMLKINNKKDNIAVISAFVYMIIVFFVAIFLLVLACADNLEVVDKRASNEIITVTDMERKLIKDEATPTGNVIEYRFTLKEQHKYDECLAFYTIHQAIEVYIDGDKVYSLQRAEKLDMVKTAGTNWTLIPLYAEDIGKEICVRLTPAYKQFVDSEIEFLIGPQIRIIVKSLQKSLPILMISGLAIVLGVILLALSIYLMWKDKRMNEIFSFGIFALLLGVWRFTDNEFSPYLSPEKPLLLFYMSVLAMMIGIIPMVNAQKSRTRTNISDVYCLVVGIISILMMAMDIFDIIDIREVLFIVHIMLFIGLGLIILNLIKAHGIKDPKPGDNIDRVVLWVLIAGALGDAVIFYTTKTSAGLFFTLIAFIVSTVLKGVSFIYVYLKNERALIEKEKQLVNSRAATMMGQIRSHFVFNVLNAISGMCKYDPEKADETVVRFSRYLRANVDIMQNDTPLPFNMVLKRLEDYVALEQVRFENKINFVKDINVLNFEMPALILQPIIENAIKHGLTPKIGGGTITLKTYEEEDNIFIKITDDGVGYDINAVPREGSVGMKNIRFRLDYLMNGTMDIKSVVGTGTEVTIKIPKGE